jgi:hypothetical protein
VTIADSVKATTGSRLDNNIGDIPSSVTVVDKQQLESTNAQNINENTLPVPAAAKPPSAPIARRDVQVGGFIAGFGGRGTQDVSGVLSTSTGTYDKAAVKDLGNIAVPVPNLGAAPETNSLMFGSIAGSAKPNGQLSAESGLSGAPQASDNSAWLQSQINRGVSFGQLTTAPNTFPTDLTAP